MTSLPSPVLRCRRRRRRRWCRRRCCRRCRGRSSGRSSGRCGRRWRRRCRWRRRSRRWRRLRIGVWGATLLRWWGDRGAHQQSAGTLAHCPCAMSTTYTPHIHFCCRVPCAGIHSLDSLKFLPLPHPSVSLPTSPALPQLLTLTTLTISFGYGLQRGVTTSVLC